MNRDIRIGAAPHAAFRELGGDGGGVLLHLETTAYFRVNALGAIIWRILEDGPTFDELVRRVGAALGEPPPGLEDDVSAFVEALVERDLASIEPGFSRGA